MTEIKKKSEEETKTLAKIEEVGRAHESSSMPRLKERDLQSND